MTYLPLPFGGHAGSPPQPLPMIYLLLLAKEACQVIALAALSLDHRAAITHDDGRQRENPHVASHRVTTWMAKVASMLLFRLASWRSCTWRPACNHGNIIAPALPPPEIGFLLLLCMLSHVPLPLKLLLLLSLLWSLLLFLLLLCLLCFVIWWASLFVKFVGCVFCLVACLSVCPVCLLVLLAVGGPCLLVTVVAVAITCCCRLC